ncbi:hypothetical protein VE01_05656 [Pseudogymnoascus verrucosus]|uniref:Protein kinase domain-containing protein n=1 Tax=Pseudogymnoascus verrucosus TaxID=342668 RepID=A0A1B8GL20_9PEZI|nr:uncharacterized protein VE01_05656 [Pseudogymnoascus verrucosus]OBT96478.2 hypothetical protein VE01_05656 [Pseudogymnoascus verrucosus]
MDISHLPKFLELNHQLQEEAHVSASVNIVESASCWLFEHPEYQAWSTGKNTAFLLAGSPGTGKTVLCSTVIDALRDEHRSSESATAVLYYYFKMNDLRRATDESLFSSMLFQLCHQLGVVPTELRVLGDVANGEQPQFELLFRAFAVAVRKFSKVFIVIDAVDECSDIRRLIATLESMLDWKLDGLHLFLSAQPLPSIYNLKRKHHLHCVITADGNHQDILSLITARVSEQLDWPDTTKEHVIRMVGDRAHGSFVWATLVFAELKRFHKLQQVESALYTLPQGLADLYKTYVDGSLQRSADTEKVLVWVGYTRRPLRIDEVSEVVAINVAVDPIVSAKKQLFQGEDVLNICPELLHTTTIQTADESYQGVSLAHFTIRTYMDVELSHWNPHFEIAHACLRYLCLLDSADALSSSDYRLRFPLADYAARFWYYHVEQASISHENLDRLLPVVTEFFHGPGGLYIQNWVRLFDPDRPWISKINVSNRPPSVSTPLYYISCLGLTSLARKLLEIGKSDIDDTGGTHGTALQAAAYHGHLPIVELLLEYRADPLIRCGLHGTALQAAKFVRHTKIADLLRARMQELNTDEVGLDGDILDLPRHIVLNGSESDPYEFRRELGSGNMGYVDMVESLASGSICARKTMRIPAARRQQFADVVLIMEQLKHAHIVEILGSYSRSPNSFILMKPVAEWDLKKYMNNEGGAVADPASLVQWLGCLAHGLAYIHGNQVKHKDIKPSNLLVHGNNILYTDFDLAHVFQSPGDVTRGPTGHTAPYSAPEVADGGDRTLTTDVFSLGCVYVEMLTVIAGKKVWDIFQKSPEEPGYSYRGLNEVKAVEWLQQLSFGDKETECGEVVKLTKRMISQVRPDAVSLSDDLAFLACSSCFS